MFRYLKLGYLDQNGGGGVASWTKSKKYHLKKKNLYVCLYAFACACVYQAGEILELPQKLTHKNVI